MKSKKKKKVLRWRSEVGVPKIVDSTEGEVRILGDKKCKLYSAHGNPDQARDHKATHPIRKNLPPRPVMSSPGASTDHWWLMHPPQGSALRSRVTSTLLH
jgi:hypothetical protein